MASLNKVSPICTRFTRDQKRRVTDAAGIVSRQRGEKVTPSGLVRELVLPQVDRIIAEAGRASDRAADEDEEPALAA